MVGSRSSRGRVGRVEIGVVVRLKSWRSRKWSCGGRVRSSSGRVKVVYSSRSSLVGEFGRSG